MCKRPDSGLIKSLILAHRCVLFQRAAEVPDEQKKLNRSYIGTPVMVDKRFTKQFDAFRES